MIKTLKLYCSMKFTHLSEKQENGAIWKVNSPTDEYSPKAQGQRYNKFFHMHL